MFVPRLLASRDQPDSKPGRVAKKHTAVTTRAKRQGRIRVGIGGWSYAPWRGVFYPKGLKQADELAYAGSRLTAIEINGREESIWWFDDGYPLDIQAATALVGRRRGSSGSAAGGRRARRAAPCSAPAAPGAARAQEKAMG